MVTKITDYSTTAGSNTDVAGISLAEGWAPSTVNNLMRALIAQMAGAAQSEGGWLELQTSITAGTTQTIAGSYALTSPLSHVTTCANASDGVALPANVVETQITIVNGGAYDLKIWPNNGASDTINGGSANAADANLLAAGDSRTYTAINGTNWVSHGVTVDVGPSVAAASGIMEANANFVDAVIFGPGMDPVDWSGRTAANTASLMLATVEDTGSDTQVNVWDLTSTTIASASPLATLTITGAATVTSVAAAMGYIIVGSEDGITIIDPHSGAWAERTTGWPRSLSTSTAPALINNGVINVTAKVVPGAAGDPRTGGKIPVFGGQYGAGSDTVFIMKWDGNLYNDAYTVHSHLGMQFTDTGHVLSAITTDYVTLSDQPVAAITADDWGNATHIVLNASAGHGMSLGVNTGFKAGQGGQVVAYDTDGLTIALKASNPTTASTVNAIVNRTYNSGFVVGNGRGAWLANSKTVDRSYRANTLTENGTVTEAAVETSAELKGYGPFTASNNFTRATDADWDSIGTGSATWSYWFRNTGFSSGIEWQVGIMPSGAAVRFDVYMNNAGTIVGVDTGATAGTSITTVGTYEDSAWHKLDWVRVSSTERHIYIDGVLAGSSTADAGSLTSSGDMKLGLGVKASDGSSSPAGTTKLALVRLSATAPTATQVRQMYDAEKGMFVANAKCLLQSSSTDAVLDVSVDPITSKVAVTQTDSQMIFDGLVVDSTPAVNAGASEHNLLYGGDRVEINSVNLYATIAEKSLRGDLEIVRGLKAGLPASVDLSKAKAWCVWNHSLNVILASYNVKSVTDVGLGKTDVFWSVPFKSDNYVAHTSSASNTHNTSPAAHDKDSVSIYVRNDAGSYADSGYVVCTAFGELENE